MKLRLIEISKFKKLLNQYPKGHIAVYSPQCTLLVLDENKEHCGSIYLKG